MEKTAAVATPLAELSQNVIYLMGLSFVLGSLFTIFILIMLELLRLRRSRKV